MYPDALLNGALCARYAHSPPTARLVAANIEEGTEVPYDSTGIRSAVGVLVFLTYKKKKNLKSAGELVTYLPVQLIVVHYISTSGVM